MNAIVHRIRLKEGSSPAEFERWVKEVDYRTAPSLASLVSFAVHRVATRSGARPEYFEVIGVSSLAAFEADMKTPVFQSLVDRFTTMAEVADEIQGERIEPGFARR